MIHIILRGSSFSAFCVFVLLSLLLPSIIRESVDPFPDRGVVCIFFFFNLSLCNILKN